MLEVADLRVSYGDIKAVKSVSLNVAQGEIVSVIGANGAGKTSTLKALAGLLDHSGEVTFEGQRLRSGMPPHKRVREGLVLVPEGRSIISEMSVYENLLMGAYAKRRELDPESEAEEILDRFPVLRERKRVAAGLLSGGEQQMLAIGRGLMAKPTLLMLDEPSLGLAPVLVNNVLEIVQGLRDSGITILLVEQKARQALKIADRAYVMETGRVVADGPTSELLTSPVVQEAFLGGRANSSSEKSKVQDSEDDEETTTAVAIDDPETGGHRA